VLVTDEGFLSLSLPPLFSEDFLPVCLHPTVSVPIISGL
jgi:hypothetical protein